MSFSRELPHERYQRDPLFARVHLLEDFVSEQERVTPGRKIRNGVLWIVGMALFDALLGAWLIVRYLHKI